MRSALLTTSSASSSVIGVAYELVYVREALEDLKYLPKGDRLTVLAQIERFLTHEPTKESRARIRRLRSGVFPPYRCASIPIVYFTM